MSVDLFFKLKEIDSLKKMRISYLKTRCDHQDRIGKLNDRREAALSQIAKLKQETISTHLELAEVEKKLKNAAEQKQRLLDIGGDDKKVRNYQNEVEQFEERGLEFLMRLDEIEIEIQESKTFVAGLDKTILEIHNESKEELEKIDQEIKNIDLRSELLMEELPQEYKNLLQKITAKNLAHGPFTRIDQGSCYLCRFKISRLEESEIDMQKNLKVCPQCSRIFLPYGA